MTATASEIGQAIVKDNILNVLLANDFNIDYNAMYGFTATGNDIKVRVWIKKLEELNP